MALVPTYAPAPLDRPPTLVIFDCDGVLVDSEPISCGVLAAALTRAGLATTLADARRDYQGLMLDQVIDQAERRLGHALPAGWLERYEDERSAAFRRELRPVPGIEPVLEALSAARVPVCVASQGTPEKMDLTLALTGLDAYFDADVVFSAWQVPRGKPHPDLFLHAAARMGVAARDCVVVEDSPSGVHGARAAEMTVLGFAADADPVALADAGARVFAAMSELPALLGLGPALAPSPAPSPARSRGDGGGGGRDPSPALHRR
jgi:HAD superfamily hydrolase (TIGR01509 family)